MKFLLLMVRLVYCACFFLLLCVFVGGVDSGAGGGGLYGGVEPPFACVEKVGMFPPYIEG